MKKALAIFLGFGCLLALFNFCAAVMFFNDHYKERECHASNGAWVTTPDFKECLTLDQE